VSNPAQIKILHIFYSRLIYVLLNFPFIHCPPRLCAAPVIAAPLCGSQDGCGNDGGGVIIPHKQDKENHYKGIVAREFHGFFDTSTI
jgi:hypothetical protein